MPRNDDLRTTIGLLIQAAFPVAQIFGLVSFTGDEVATIMAFIGIALQLVFRFVKTGQEADTETTAKLVNAEIARRIEAGLLMPAAPTTGGGMHPAGAG